MSRKLFYLFVGLALVALMLSISTNVSALTSAERPLAQSSLPTISFLGEGPGTFTAAPGTVLLVKTYEGGQFLFVAVDGDTYEAADDERVWQTNFVPSESIRLFHEERNYGSVTAGCVVNFVQIEDNDDNRRNTFYVNGEVVHVVEQGMVTYGSFTVPEDGVLTFYAEDSIGMVIELCTGVQTSVPSVVPPTVTGTVPAATATATATFTATTVPPTATATETSTATSVPPTATNTLPPPPTATNTLPPTAVVVLPSATPTTAPPSVATATGTLSVPPATSTVAVVTVTPVTATATTGATVSAPGTSPTPTNTVPVALVQITATPQATARAIPVTGGVPGPGEIATISAGIFGLFGLLGAGWYYLLRAFRNDR